jgi:hypothetical protein
VKSSMLSAWNVPSMESLAAIEPDFAAVFRHAHFGIGVEIDLGAIAQGERFVAADGCFVTAFLGLHRVEGRCSGNADDERCRGGAKQHRREAAAYGVQETVAGIAARGAQTIRPVPCGFETPEGGGMGKRLAEPLLQSGLILFAPGAAVVARQPFGGFGADGFSVLAHGFLLTSGGSP